MKKLHRGDSNEAATRPRYVRPFRRSMEQYVRQLRQVNNLGHGAQSEAAHPDGISSAQLLRTYRRLSNRVWNLYPLLHVGLIVTIRGITLNRDDDPDTASVSAIGPGEGWLHYSIWNTGIPTDATARQNVGANGWVVAQIGDVTLDMQNVPVPDVNIQLVLFPPLSLANWDTAWPGEREVDLIYLADTVIEFNGIPIKTISRYQAASDWTNVFLDLRRLLRLPLLRPADRRDY